MKKLSSFVFISLCCLIVFSQTNVSVGPEQKIKSEMKMPGAVKPGSEFIVEIKIFKGNVSGLCRFQQFLPKGMTASSIENAGADFSFENQNVKFFWMSIPKEESISIKYK